MDGVCCRGEKYRVLMARFADAGYRVFCEDGEDTHIIMDYSTRKKDLLGRTPLGFNDSGLMLWVSCATWPQRNRYSWP